MTLPASSAPIDRQPPWASGFALWGLGFRPFYLVASLFSVISIALWISQYTGQQTLIDPLQPPGQIRILSAVHPNPDIW
jgi:hypothetical protein